MNRYGISLRLIFTKTLELYKPPVEAIHELPLQSSQQIIHFYNVLLFTLNYST